MNKRNKFLLRSSYLVLILVFIFLLMEVSVRVLGLVDFPLHDANPNIGYIPSANQRGSFLNKNDWIVNELHMGTEEFKPVNGRNVLLIGDSLVNGGNPLGQQDRLGSHLHALLKQDNGAIWPISAGSWALRNELAYLRLYPQVLQRVDKVVFLINSGDFGDGSSWTCELNMPTYYPRIATWYLFNKYVYSIARCGEPPPDKKFFHGSLKQELIEYLSINAENLFLYYTQTL